MQKPDSDTKNHPDAFDIDIGTVLDISIKSVASTGKGVGLVEVSGYNRPVFVSFTAPGDLCKVEIIKKEKQYYEAKLLEVIKPSDARITPPCQHYTFCGGCNFLHIKYEEQLKIKKQILEFLLKRANISYPEIEVIGSKQEYFYREKIKITKKGKLGFYRHQSNDIVKIKKCYIINDEFNKSFPKIAKKLKFGEHVLIHDSETNDVILPNDERYATYSYDDIKFSFNNNSFIQSNLSTNDILINTIVDNVKGKNVLDLYCGIGNFTLPIAKKTTQVVGVEGNPFAVKLLIKNIKENSILNVKTINEDVVYYMKRNEKQFDTILLDPPRVGVGNSEVLSSISKATKNLIYVSCNPEVLAKELKQLKLFKIKKIYLIDMFPQTNHFETVVVMSK